MQNNLFKDACKKGTIVNETKEISSDERIAYESNKILGRAYTILGILLPLILGWTIDVLFVLGIVSYGCLIQFSRKGLIENNTASVGIVMWSLVVFPFALVGSIFKFFYVTPKIYVYIPLVLVTGIIIYLIAQNVYDRSMESK